MERSKEAKYGGLVPLKEQKQQHIIKRQIWAPYKYVIVCYYCKVNNIVGIRKECWDCHIPIPKKYSKLAKLLNFMDKL